jgi:ABC-type polysaccharide/polyol phosphate export permease
VPYALFAFAGLVPWTFFSASLGSCVNSLTANRNLVTKVYFPREVFPLACVAGAFVDFCVAMAVLAGLIAYFHGTGAWTFTPQWTLLFLPVVVGTQIALTIGLGMLLAMGNLFYRDVRQIAGIAIQLWMFISAVVIPVPRGSSLLARIIGYNPLVPIIEAYRACLLDHPWPPAAQFVYAMAVATAVLIGGWLWFRRASFRFAECI